MSPDYLKYALAKQVETIQTASSAYGDIPLCELPDDAQQRIRSAIASELRRELRRKREASRP